MTRVQLRVRHLVVHGSGAFDGETFVETLERDMLRRLGEGSRLSSETRATGNSSRPNPSHSTASDKGAAHAVVERLFN